jgi:ABC-type antimicrobial peptide transport system permease subunit
MFKNYLKTAYRSLLRNRSYTFINIAGLTLGISVCLIIFQLIRYELEFDRIHPNAERIYRVVRDAKNSSGVEKSTVTPYPFSEAFRNDFPEIPVTQFHFQYETLMTIGEEKSEVTNIAFADSLFFEILGFEVLSGNPKVELAQPGKVFVTESYLKKIGDEKVKHIKLGNIIDLEVAGVIKDPSTPSHININMVASYRSLKGIEEQFVGFPLDQWGLNSAGFSYILLPENQTKEQLEARFPDFINKYYSKEDVERQKYSLQPLSAIHFDQEYEDNPGTSTISPSVLIVMGCIALFILVIACVNFINLSTALSIRKGKEVGVRKTLGAQQSQLALQYLSEAILLTLIAAIISLGFAEVATPALGQFLEKSLPPSNLHDSPTLGFLGALILVTSLFAGAYPALVLSKFNPIDALKSRFATQQDSSVSLRKSLVVLQFFIAQVLIICTLVVASQIRYFQNKSLGFAKEAVVNVPLPDNKKETLESFRMRLMAAGIKDVSFSLSAPMGDYNFGTGMHRPDVNTEERYTVRIKPVDTHYKDVYGLDLLAGRWFYESEEKEAGLEKPEDRQYAFILNETAMHTLGFASPEDAIGKHVTIGLNDIEAPVVGVVRDFHTSSLHNAMESVVMLNFPSLYYDAGVKITMSSAATELKTIEEVWTQLFPAYLYKYTFLDDYVERLYREEERMFAVFEMFAGIAIFIGCLGLFGLVSFMANQKVKEVAIRKTLGASTAQIVQLFSKEFIWLVIIAFIIAAPVAWYTMQLWLSEFAFKVDVSWLVFAAAILITLLISFVTVGYRSMRAAQSNPVNALKSE